MTPLFLNPLFLALGAASLAVPVVIHLLRNRKFLPAYLGTTRFIASLVRENQKWRRLHDLLLLIARLLILALLAALFARPALVDPKKQEAERLHAVILVDTSASMSASVYGTPNAEIARARLRETLKAFPQNARVTVAAFADAVRKLESPEDALPTPAGAGNPREALLWALAQFKDSPSRNRQVFLISDLQSPEGASPVANWPEDVRLHLLDTALPADWNAAITAPAMLAFDPAQKAAVPVTVRTFGVPPPVRGDAKPATLTLRIQGEKPVTLQLPAAPAANPAVIPVAFPLPKPGTYRATVTLENGDAYAFDNTRHLVIHVRSPRNLLLVDGARGGTRFQDETYFLRHALDATTPPEGTSLFKYQFRYDHAGNTAPFQALVFANVPAPSDDDVRQIRALLARGGNVLFFLGNRIQADAYNRLREAELFPAALAPLPEAKPHAISEWSATHPVLGHFNPRDPATLSQMPFVSHFRLTPHPAAAVLATLDDGQPAILQLPSGSGSILLINNSADRDWSDWAIDPLYAPLISELLGHLAKPPADNPPLVEQAATSISAPELPPGISAKPGKPFLAVHHPDAESATAPIPDPDAFRSALNLPKADPAEPPILTTPVAPNHASRPDEIWHWLALALLLLIVTEALLAHGKSKS
jgi:hypothetical protein